MAFSRFALIDHDTARKAQISMAMNDSGTFCDPFTTIEELLDTPSKNRCILYADDGKISAVNALTHLEKQGHGHLLIAFANQAEVERASDTILAGAIDYLGWPFSIITMIERLQDRELKFAAISDRRQRRIAAKAKLTVLTDREMMVIEKIAEGFSNKAIAGELKISPRTVEIHRANALRKLDLNHTSKAIRLKLESEML